MLVIKTKDPDQTRAVGQALAKIVRAGDLIMLSGGLGAGKTTFTQGLGEGMGVRGRVASPTFIIAREHPNPNGPNLIHADAYRINDLDDLETLDLDASLDTAVTVVEWGEGKTEAMSEDRLEIEIRRAGGDLTVATEGEVVDLAEADDGSRDIVITPCSDRWSEEDLNILATALKSEENK
ncbi:tRNA (adenosine(37)-N6)-threonylcarbamoyltransferase complex ATPase subunit type 1 TsaE [Boudabousia tangfeifanii]|uniref:tRNA threonylcarbamoyladenosine biosynthesis protein TsaE n=1 Tax=Boudabousia tangfeifanii TaxID=1912795 RepID=A0A1D9MJA5_9ACTO|nr:tRNA (adenosine(37)-N6)-threonylcarbamoyltransferase complex ATPase subunit type 1 TsaE [Boudabousia tangfeifanii]AOZ72260.1 tRNA (adenosine(37)-N6)-threonylcarbamoyltransferase complex ATPase subunit type 1 TsaE [Boudabousia tangfeifanii]